MTLLGKFIKQPDEVESYTVVLTQALGSTDEAVSTFGLITLPRGVPKIRYTPAVPSEALQSDTSIISDVNFSLPLVPAGGRFYIANKSPTIPIFITYGGYSEGNNVMVHEVPPCGSVVLVSDGQNDYSVEAYITTVLVKGDRDFRVRTFVHGGVDAESYKVELTTTTAEGRVLQDEFIVKIKDV